MRADRLVALVLLLQSRGRVSARGIAAELEVSVRTVYRDVEALGAAGVPVVAERGPEGGYRLVDGYRTRLTGLSEAEARALFLVGAPGPARDLGLEGVLAGARLKLNAALGAGPGAHAARVQERFHLDAAGWFREAEPVPHLAAVATAVWEQRELRASYVRNGAAGERVLRPLGIVLKGGIWYVVAEGAERGDVRTYRMTRFREVAETGAEFVRPAGFELAAYWEESARQLAAALYEGTAGLRLSPLAQRTLPAQFGAAGTRALADAGPPDADGWVRVDLAVEALPVAVSDVLRLGTEAEVLGPPELRDAVAAAVAALAARYGVSGAG